MTRFIVHIGPHKTGSTYLQNHLTHNRAALADRGVYYPGAWTTPEIGWCHAELAALLQQGSFDSVARKFAELKSAGWPRIVLSSEDSSSLGEDRLRFLAECTGADTEIVFFARRWGELLGSCNQEHIRQGGTKLLPEFVAGILSHPFGSDTINFSRVLDRFAHAFGASRLRVLSFNNILKRGDNLFSYFAAKVLGVDDMPVISSSPAHASLSIENIELVRALNVLHAQQLGETPWQPNSILPAVLRSPLPCTRKAMTGSVAEIRFNEFAEPFKSVYDLTVAKYHEVMDKEFDAPEQLLFERQRSHLRYVDTNYLMDPAVLPELSDFLAQLTGQPQTAERPAARQHSVPSETVSIEFSGAGNSASYCATGWSAPEEGWQWATGSEARLLLPDRMRAEDYLLTLKLRPFLAGPHLSRQRMTIEIDGVALAYFEVADTEPSVRSCTIPASMLARAGGIAIVFRTPDAARPADLGRSDSRKLSFAFHTLTLTPAGENRSLNNAGTLDAGPFPGAIAARG